MSDGLSADRLRSALKRLVELITSTTSDESRVKQELSSEKSAAESEFETKRAALESELKASRKVVDDEFRTRKHRLKSEFEGEYDRTKREFRESVQRINDKAAANEQAAKKGLQEALWLTETVFDATENQPQEKYDLARKEIDGCLEEIQTAREAAATALRRFRQTGLARRVMEPSEQSAIEEQVASVEARAALDEQQAQVHTLLAQIKSNPLGKLLVGLWPIVLIIVLAGIAGVAISARESWQVNAAVITAAGIGAGAAIVLLAIIFILARTQLAGPVSRTRSAAARANALAALATQHADETLERGRIERIETRDREVREAHEKFEPIIAEIQQRREQHLERLNEKYPATLEELKQTYERDKAELMAEYEDRVRTLKEDHKKSLEQAQNQRDERLSKAQSAFDGAWNDLVSRWKEGVSSAASVIEHSQQESARLFPSWNDAAWNDWSPPREFAPAIRFGQMQVDLASLPDGLPKDAEFALPERLAKSFSVPALLSFPDHCSLLVQAASEGRSDAVRIIQTVMFRLLSALPPGKVRFTIIDPVGLGENFAGFMHLADYDGAYVTDRIWTEDRHIEQRLLDLTEHMENVIQKYLRNQYETIAQYNEDAGEIAEPFRFLVIANFPVNFSENAARRLASIINSGARCGVYTLITADTRQALPQGIAWDDLSRRSETLAFDAGKFAWDDEVVQEFPLSVDEPPSDEFITSKLHIIGEAAKDSSRVEVPFDVIAPTPAKMWSMDTTSELRVALGRAGATKLQQLALGQGTAQHALIAGKTGSGKSTLLHAMITNLALWYPPDEVEFYLIDFKKGVEFKTYATHHLPHARAVAIESDREFGLSVLQRLDSELRRRGNIFRDLGVQDLAGYRRGNSRDPMPRVLLIIDEFQELFTEDDKIAQDSALLLDRLVRQGRAFGMHVILGSQTLGGAYTLARSTINQMAVRIALQCSEADSYLILSDDNAAARLLSRPGEAIYNDASGMVEGNNPFQIVWLPDDKRDVYLKRVTERASRAGWKPVESTIVFEGNVPADVSRNLELDALLGRAEWPKAGSTALAWLGEPIAIKDPTAVSFRRQSGSNLLIVGQRDDSAMAMMTMSLMSLAAQYPPGSAKFYVLDGTPADAPGPGSGVLEKIATKLPHGVNFVGWRDVPQAIDEVARELAARESGESADTSPIFLFIHALQRFRMLRQEEDFGFSSSSGDDAPKPDKQFGQIIREGPVHGMHVLTWCDTAGNLTRALDRQSLREFESRVLFQMGSTDSSNLIDSPAAAKLGPYRALFFSEEQGVIEKFRPYAVPDERWLDAVIAQMNKRAPNNR